MFGISLTTIGYIVAAVCALVLIGYIDLKLTHRRVLGGRLIVVRGEQLTVLAAMERLFGQKNCQLSPITDDLKGADKGVLTRVVVGKSTYRDTQKIKDQLTALNKIHKGGTYVVSYNGEHPDEGVMSGVGTFLINTALEAISPLVLEIKEEHRVKIHKSCIRDYSLKEVSAVFKECGFVVEHAPCIETADPKGFFTNKKHRID